MEVGAQRKRIPAEETGEACPKCGEGRQVIRSGKFENFYLVHYFEVRLEEQIRGKNRVKCPLCHDGDVVVKKTKKAVIFRLFKLSEL